MLTSSGAELPLLRGIPYRWRLRRPCVAKLRHLRQRSTCFCTMGTLGLECTFVDPHCTDEELEGGVPAPFKCVFGETIANPGASGARRQALRQTRMRHAADRGQHVRRPSCSPIGGRRHRDLALDHQVHRRPRRDRWAARSWIPRGKFDWMRSDKFPRLTARRATMASSTPRGSALRARSSPSAQRSCRDFGAIVAAARSSSTPAWKTCICACRSTAERPGDGAPVSDHPKVAWVPPSLASG